MMYSDETYKVIMHNDPVIGPDGTRYPANYPKSEMPWLHPVTETASPSSPGIVVTGFHIDSSYTQVWDYRIETTDERKARINSAIFARLNEIDTKSIRALRENDSARILALEAEATELRNQIIK